MSEDQIQVLKAPFPPEALSSDNSRGFVLTAIRAAFCHRAAHQGRWPLRGRLALYPQPVRGAARRQRYVKIVTEIAFQYRFPAASDCTGCDQVMWNAQADDGAAACAEMRASGTEAAV